MTTPKTPAEKVPFFKENEFWFKTSMVKKASKPAYFDKTLRAVCNQEDGIMKFIKTDTEIAEQKRANQLNLPSSLRK